jgi:hypothetical protein
LCISNISAPKFFCFFVTKSLDLGLT